MIAIRFLLVPLAATAAGSASGQSWPGEPRTAPPPAGSKGPPPAWIETRVRSTWLAYGSYCWKTLCVDMIPPAMRDDIPDVRLRRGRAVRLHFRFQPRALTLTVGPTGRPVRFRPSRAITWRPRKGGLVMVAAETRTGDASYLFRLRVLR